MIKVFAVSENIQAGIKSSAVVLTLLTINGEFEITFPQKTARYVADLLNRTADELDPQEDK